MRSRVEDLPDHVQFQPDLHSRELPPPASAVTVVVPDLPKGFGDAASPAHSVSLPPPVPGSDDPRLATVVAWQVLAVYENSGFIPWVAR